MSNVKDRFSKIDVQSAKEVISNKVQVVNAAPAPKLKVTEEEMNLAAIKTITTQIDKADISVRAVRKKKDNLNLTEKSELQLERAILVADAMKTSKREVVVGQRLIEELFMIGEHLKHLAFTGDKTAIKMLEDMRKTGIVDDYVYKKK